MTIELGISKAYTVAAVTFSASTAVSRHLLHVCASVSSGR